MTFLSIRDAIRDLLRYRYLIVQLTMRDVILKYRGSYLGVAWSFLYPLLLLISFTFVFDKVIGSRWPQPEGKSVPLVLIMYSGLIVFTLFSEVAGAAPRLIHNYQSYVKKIIFPIQILPVVPVVVACIHAAINILLLALACAIAGVTHLSMLLAPILIAPAVFFVLGVAWAFSASGVYVRDLAHVMPVLVQATMFFCPVFYAVRAVPPSLQWFYRFNPISVSMEELRRAMLWGQMPDWTSWWIAVAVSAVAVLAGYAFFARSKEEFADVL